MSEPHQTGRHPNMRNGTGGSTFEVSDEMRHRYEDHLRARRKTERKRAPVMPLTESQATQQRARKRDCEIEKRRRKTELNLYQPTFSDADSPKGWSLDNYWHGAQWDQVDMGNATSSSTSGGAAPVLGCNTAPQSNELDVALPIPFRNTARRTEPHQARLAFPAQEDQEERSTRSTTSPLAAASQSVTQQPKLNLNHRTNGSGCLNEPIHNRRHNNKGPPLTSRGAPTPGTRRARGRTRRSSLSLPAA